MKFSNRLFLRLAVVFLGGLCFLPEAKADTVNAEFFDFTPNDMCVVEYDVVGVRFILLEKTSKPRESNVGVEVPKASDNNLKPSDIIAIVAVVVSAFLSAVTLYLNFRSASENHKNSVHDEFWMRQILIPQFINPFMRFIDESSAIFANNGNNLTDYYTSYALSQLNQLEDSIIVIKAVSPSLGEKLSQVIEDFHDKVGEEDTINTLSDFRSNLLMEASRDVVAAIKAEQLREKKNFFHRLFSSVKH
ncbi:hypothetical protein [Vibrio cholerae]|uniref:hypothetical protein n=1 Tax=Vibrio cholerae TaxID=666 RepID=UPI002934830E|nr:hypothetical protein [Vibrio cholerae]EKF9739661.1 hypothetical protein [Vibrio cholerae]MDV2304500.1 hypothetical protein [Vibrio cholerae]